MKAAPTYLSRTEMEQELTTPVAGAEGEAWSELVSRSVTNAEEFLLFEQDAHRIGAAVADMVIRRKILETHFDRPFVKAATAEVRERAKAAGETRPVANVGPNPLGVYLPGGDIVYLQTPYLRPSRKGLVGRPRTRRGKGGSGFYPVLARLGVSDGVTPLTRSRIARQIVLSGSYAEAHAELAAAGLALDLGTLVRVAVATGEAAIEQRDAALSRALASPLPERSLVAGQRIRVSMDGGRARTRRSHRDRRKQKNGRRAFVLEWREPRVITIDILDAEGRMDHEHRPIYEVVVGDADEVYRTLTGLLRLIGAHLAAEVVIVADGADWIWNRMDRLIEDAGLPRDRVRQILDYWHATEHISDALKACKSMPEAERAVLLDELKGKLLKPDGVKQVVARLAELARGRRAAKINKEIAYIEGHAEHMRYAELRAADVPIGSGVVESAVRRVLNLRFKSASMCWRVDHLAPLLYLRAIAKAGRWDDFMSAFLTHRHWLHLPTSAMSVSRAA